MKFFKLLALAFGALLLWLPAILISAMIMAIFPLIWIGLIIIFPTWFVAIASQWWEYREISWIPEKFFWAEGLLAEGLLIGILAIFALIP